MGTKVSTLYAEWQFQHDILVYAANVREQNCDMKHAVHGITSVLVVCMSSDLFTCSVLFNFKYNVHKRLFF